MVRAAGHMLRAKGGKAPPERCLDFRVCPKGHACSKSPSTIMNSTTVGRAPKAPAPLLWRRPKAASILVDGEIDGSMYYGAIYPSISGSENGARNNNPSGSIINSGGRIIVRPLVFVYS